MAMFFRRYLEPVVFCAQVASAFFDTGLQMVSKQSCEHVNGTSTGEQNRQNCISDFYMVFNMLIKFVPILPAIILARIGDKGYRMVPIIVPLIGYAVSRLLLVFVIVYEWPLTVMYAAPVVHGLCGGFTSYWAGIMAVISVTTKELDRSLRIMRIELVFGLAGLLGSLASGHLFQLYTVGLKQGVVLAVISVVLYFLCLMYAICTSQTIVKSGHDRHESPVEVTRNTTNMVLLFVGGILYDVAVTGGVEILSVYVLEEPLSWTATEVGYGNAFGSFIFITSFIGVKLFTRCALSDTSMVIIGMISFLSGIYFMTFVSTTTTFYLARSLMFLALIPMPTIRSLLSKQVRGNSYGMTFTALQLLFKLVGLATTPTYTKLYQSKLHSFPGFVFALSSIITFFAIIPISIVGCRSARQEHYERL